MRKVISWIPAFGQQNRKLLTRMNFLGRCRRILLVSAVAIFTCYEVNALSAFSGEGGIEEPREVVI